MLCIIIGIIVAVLIGIDWYKRDEFELIGCVIIGFASWFTVSMLLALLSLGGVGTKEFDKTYEIKNFGSYYSIASDGKVSVSIVNDEGKCVPESYEKHKVKFKDGNTANVKVTYQKGYSKWLTHIGSSDIVKNVIITLPPVE